MSTLKVTARVLYRQIGSDWKGMVYVACVETIGPRLDAVKEMLALRAKDLLAREGEELEVEIISLEEISL